MDVRARFDIVDRFIVNLMDTYGLRMLRYSLGIVFIWFGILKPLGMSPASGLVAATVTWFDPAWFIPFLGWWEVAIGICLLYRPLIRVGILLLALQMAGTFLPLVLLPDLTFTSFPYAPSMEGQYIIKNIVIISAAVVIGSKVREKQI